MRPLSAQQAASCEKASAARCRCRCGGASHGAARMVEAEREFFEALPADDPHWIPMAKQMRLPKEFLPQPTYSFGTPSTTAAAAGTVTIYGVEPKQSFTTGQLLEGDG